MATTWKVALCSGVVVALGACSSGSGYGGGYGQVSPGNAAPPLTPGSSPTVSLKNTQFAPNPDDVSRGTKVTWKNDEAVAHTVTSGRRASPDGRFDQPLDARGATFSFSFPEAGRFFYHCKIHPRMNGQIIVS